MVGIGGLENPFIAAEYAIDIAKKYGSTYFLSVIPSKIHHSDSSGNFGVIQSYYFDEYKRNQINGSKIVNKAKGKENFDFDKKIKQLH